MSENQLPSMLHVMVQWMLEIYTDWWLVEINFFFKDFNKVYSGQFTILAL
jgi:hypothetical protein